MRIVSSLLAVALLAFSFAARAERAQLRVDRGAGAERCPDADAIGDNVEQIRGRGAIDKRSLYRVTFSRTENGFAAAIRAETTDRSVRTLDHIGPSCAPLGRAVALTIALILDSEVAPEEPVEPTPPTVTRAPPVEILD